MSIIIIKLRILPWEIIQERDPNTNPQIVSLPPVFLDELLIQNLNSQPQGGTMLFRIPVGAHLIFNPFYMAPA